MLKLLPIQGKKKRGREEKGEKKREERRE